MTTITLDKAQADLPDLVKRALEGEDIVIAADGKRVRLAVVADAAEVLPSSFRGRGLLKGQLVVGPEFFEALPDDEMRYWEGRGDE